MRTGVAAALAALLVMAACANSGAQAPIIVDGPKGPQYEQDLAECRAAASQKSPVDGNQATSAAVLAGVGAVVGGLNNGASGAAAGAAIGGGTGLGGAALDSQKERSAIVRRCMIGRGYNVIG